MKYLDLLAKEIWGTAEDAGWHEKISTSVEGNCTRIALIHSEVTEALEAYRGHGAETWEGESGKPEGIGSELADTIIRVLELAWILDVPIHDIVNEKMAFNTRRKDVPARGGTKAF